MGKSGAYAQRVLFLDHVGLDQAASSDFTPLKRLQKFNESGFS